jgi:hypothetical protein
MHKDVVSGCLGFLVRIVGKIIYVREQILRMQ